MKYLIERLAVWWYEHPERVIAISLCFYLCVVGVLGYIGWLLIAALQKYLAQ